MSMRYKDYVWPCGPETVQVSCGRRLAEFGQPYAGAVVQNMGGKNRVVTGSGVFVGADCEKEFEKLTSMLAESDSGMLMLTGMMPFPAFFSSLVIKGEVGPDCLAYEFVFVEDAPEREENTDGGVYLCTGGETLWGLAAKFSTTADEIHSLNPMVKWPNNLPAGLKVVLP